LSGQSWSWLESDIGLELLNFGVIGSSKIGNFSAAQVAARADLVIVCFHGKVWLPIKVKAGIEIWSCLIANRSAALSSRKS
jgi:hypothetical protein